MNNVERAKAMVVQLETLRHGERLNPSHRILTRFECAFALKVADAASSGLHPAVTRDLLLRIRAVDDWLIGNGR